MGRTILVHKYVPQLALPTKSEKFDWTLGPNAQELRETTGADYGLFVFIRDSYTSAGRAAVIVFAALLGVSVPGGYTAGFASLVDLNTGDVVWFNRLVSRSGDLRTAGPARDVINSLLAGIPL